MRFRFCRSRRADDRRVVGRPLGAAVPAVVVVGAVAVVLAVGLVVLVVVADQVVQREAVVAGDEVDAGVRLAAAPLVQVAASRSGAWRTRWPCRRRPSRSGGRCRGTCRSTRSTAPGSCPPGSRPAPTSHGSAISFTCERTGSWWMMSKNAPSLFDLVQLAGQRAGQVEAEAVDVHLRHPVAQAVHDELQHARVLHVERVAAAGEVHVVARVFGRRGGSTRRCRCPRSDSVGPIWLPSAGVVVDHVEDHLDARPRAAPRTIILNSLHRVCAASRREA